MKFRYIIIDILDDPLGTNDLELAKKAAEELIVVDCELGCTLGWKGALGDAIPEATPELFE